MSRKSSVCELQLYGMLDAVLNHRLSSEHLIEYHADDLSMKEAIFGMWHFPGRKALAPRRTPILVMLQRFAGFT